MSKIAVITVFAVAVLAVIADPDHHDQGYYRSFYYPAPLPVQYPAFPAYPPYFLQRSYNPFYSVAAPQFRQSPSPIIDESKSDQDALKDLMDLKETFEASDDDKRFLIPSIEVSDNGNTVTIKTTTFVSLLNSLASSVTVSVTTKTVLIPGVTYAFG